MQSSFFSPTHDSRNGRDEVLNILDVPTPSNRTPLHTRTIVRTVRCLQTVKLVSQCHFGITSESRYTKYLYCTPTPPLL